METPGPKAPVLVVDDDAAFRKLVEQVLAAHEVLSHGVRSAEEALRWVDKNTPRAVIIDGLLPGLRGDELALRLRKRMPREQVPIVFISSFFRDLRSRLHLTRECQVDLVLHKPISPLELERALVRVPSLLPLAEKVKSDEFDIELDVTLDEEQVADYLEEARSQVAAMRTALSLLGPSDAGRSALAALRTEAHRLAGTGGSFGFPEVTRLGRNLEQLVDQVVDGKVREEQRASMVGLVEALAAKLDRSGGRAAVETREDAARSLRVMVLDGPGALADSCHEAAHRGEPVRIFQDVDAALSSSTQEPPDVTFVAADVPGLGAEACERLAQAQVKPVLLMARDPALAPRLEALRRGIDGYVHRLPDAQAVQRHAREYARLRSGTQVLALDASPERLSALAEALAPHRMMVEPCISAEAFFGALEVVRPAVVLVTAPLPDVDALSLVRSLRADARFRRTSVVVLTSTDDVDARLAALDAGADDAVGPLGGHPELVARVRAQAVRRAREERDALLDPLTGTFNATYFRLACSRAVAQARRGRPLAVLLFALDAQALETHGPLVAEEAMGALAAQMRARFRAADLVARVGAHQLAVLAYDVAPAEAQRLLERHREGLSPLSLSGGLTVAVKTSFAAFPEVLGGAEALLSAAEQRLS